MRSWNLSKAASKAVQTLLVLRTPQCMARLELSTKVPTCWGACPAGAPADAGAGLPPPLEMSCCTSAATMRPPGPLPFACAMSTPASRASLRAYGLATTRPPAHINTANSAIETVNVGVAACHMRNVHTCVSRQLARTWARLECTSRIRRIAMLMLLHA